MVEVPANVIKEAVGMREDDLMNIKYLLQSYTPQCLCYVVNQMSKRGQYNVVSKQGDK